MGWYSDDDYVLGHRPVICLDSNLLICIDQGNQEVALALRDMLRRGFRFLLMPTVWQEYFVNSQGDRVILDDDAIAWGQYTPCEVIYTLVYQTLMRLRTNLKAERDPMHGVRAGTVMVAMPEMEHCELAARDVWDRYRKITGASRPSLQNDLRLLVYAWSLLRPVWTGNPRDFLNVQAVLPFFTRRSLTGDRKMVPVFTTEDVRRHLDGNLVRMGSGAALHSVRDLKTRQCLAQYLMPGVRI